MFIREISCWPFRIVFEPNSIIGMIFASTNSFWVNSIVPWIAVGWWAKSLISMIFSLSNKIWNLLLTPLKDSSNFFAVSSSKKFIRTFDAKLAFVSEIVSPWALKNSISQLVSNSWTLSLNDFLTAPIFTSVSYTHLTLPTT